MADYKSMYYHLMGHTGMSVELLDKSIGLLEISNKSIKEITDRNSDTVSDMTDTNTKLIRDLSESITEISDANAETVDKITETNAKTIRDITKSIIEITETNAKSMKDIIVSNCESIKSVCKIIEKTSQSLYELKDTIKNAHLTTEEMFLSSNDPNDLEN